MSSWELMTVTSCARIALHPLNTRALCCQLTYSHVFKGEGFSTPTDERHCVNGISLNFKEDEGK
jgi:peptide-methionine (R)-S-oxide reductase